MEKSKLFAFIFAFCPGAGEMYMGMMKKGMVIMATFWGIIGITGFLHMGFLSFLLPVIWFYSFFDTFNVASLPLEQRQAIDTAFFSNIDLNFTSGTLAAFAKRRKTVLGWGGIILGIWMLLDWVAFPVIRAILEYMGLDSYRFNYGTGMIPNIIVAVIIIVLGVRIIRKKDPVPPTSDDLVEFSGRPFEVPAGLSNQPYTPPAGLSNQPYAPTTGLSNQPYAPTTGLSNQPYAPTTGLSNQPYAPPAGLSNQPYAPPAGYSGNPPEAL